MGTPEQAEIKHDLEGQAADRRWAEALLRAETTRVSADHDDLDSLFNGQKKFTSEEWDALLKAYQEGRPILIGVLFTRKLDEVRAWKLLEPTP